MARVPRYGVHDGVKYSPRRTLMRWCEVCGEPFINNGRGKKYCSEECRHEVKYNIDSGYMKEYMKKYYQDNKEYFKNYQKEYIKKVGTEYRSQKWKEWYNNLTPEARKEYITKRNNRRQERMNDDPDYKKKQAEYMKTTMMNRYERNPGLKEFTEARQAYSQHIREENNWYGYEMHHLIPVALIPEFAFEEWNIIPVSPELHKNFHSKTGGTRMAKYPRWWANELVNFIYEEL